MPPLSTNPIGTIGASGAIFFGTLFLVSGARNLTASTIPRVKKWRNPPIVIFVPRVSNRYAAIELMHYGESATWEAYMRVVELPEGRTSDNPFTRPCLLRKDGKASRSVFLKHGERAGWVIAKVARYLRSSGPYMELEDSHSEYSGESIAPSGAILELELRSVPDGQREKITRYFKLSSREPEIIELTEVEQKEIKFLEI